MKALDQLNLRPQEKRILVIVFFLVFVVLNFLFVWPLFGRRSVIQDELHKNEQKLARYQQEIDRGKTYQRLEDELKKQGGDVLSEELQLQRIVDNQARASGVLVSRYTPGVRTVAGRTNQFFEDQGLTIEFNTGNKELVEFLVGLASGNSMIHVQDMTLRPDQSGTKLMGNILFVATYQKKQPTPARPTGGAPVAAKTNAPAATAPARTNAPPPAMVKPVAKPATNVSGKISTNTAKPVKK